MTTLVDKLGFLWYTVRVEYYRQETRKDSQQMAV